MTYKKNKIIWYEGMFLKPQHFQQTDRYYEQLIIQKQMALSHHAWGFSELTLDLDLLALNKIGIKTAKGIFQDGTAFQIPDKDFNPQPFELIEGMQNLTLYLCLPLQIAGVTDIGDKNSETLYRHGILRSEVTDNISNETSSEALQLAGLHCEIRSDLDDLSFFTTLPIAKIHEARSQQNISFDKTFLAPCLDIAVAPALKQFITEVHGLLDYRAQMLAGRLTDTQQAGTAEIVDFMLLQLVNRYEPLFHFLMHKKPLHPEVLFLHLIQLLGEMETFTNDKRRPQSPPVYQHLTPFETFKPVITGLRNALSVVLEQNATAIPLEARNYGVWVGKIENKDILKQCNFVLAVYADTPNEKLRAEFSQHIKIAPVEQIQTLVSRALPGIALRSIAVAPRQIPYHANFNYFSLDKSTVLWQQLTQSAGIALQVSGQYPNLKLELWAIRG